MSSHAISSSFRSVEQHLVPVDPRLQTNANEGNSCWSIIALKIAAIAGLIVFYGSFVVLGPLTACLVIGILEITAAFIACCYYSHSHPSTWHQPLSSLIPQHGSANGHHVPVGQGHLINVNMDNHARAKQY